MMIASSQHPRPGRTRGLNVHHFIIISRALFLVTLSIVSQYCPSQRDDVVVVVAKSAAG